MGTGVQAAQQTPANWPQHAWRVGLAGAVFLTLLMAAVWRGNAIFYVVGGLVALAIMAPLWRARPRVLLLGLMFYLPLQDAIIAGFPHAGALARMVPDGVLFLALGLRVVGTWRSGQRLFGTALDLPLLALLAVSAASEVANRVPLEQAAQGPYVLVRYAALFYLAASSEFTSREIRAFVRGLVGLSTVECALVFLQFSGIGATGQLPSGTMAGANTMGLYLGLVCTLAVAFYGDARVGLPRRELHVLLGASFAAIVVAMSRQSALALVIGCAAVASLLVLRACRSASGTLAAAPFISNVIRAALRDVAVSLAAISFGTVLGTVAIAQRWTGFARTALQSLGNQLVSHWVSPCIAGVVACSVAVAGRGTAASGQAGSAASAAASAAYAQQIAYKTADPNTFQLLSTNFFYNPRLYTIAHAGPAILHKSPLLGLGPGTFGAQATFHDRAFYASLNVGMLLRDPHATFVADVEWMTILGQLGLLGVVAMVWLLVGVGRTGWRIWRTSDEAVAQATGAACIALVPIFMVIAWLGPNFEIRPISSLLWFIPGLAVSLLRQPDGAAAVSSQEVLVASTQSRTCP